MTRIFRHPTPLPVPFSKAVEASGFVFLSGQLAMDATGNIVGADIAAQTKFVLERIAKTLEDVGSNMGDVVRCTVWLSDFANFAAFNEEYRKHFPEGLPARSTVEAKLFKGALVEIEVQAMAP
jgi:reactive intermediate/imine deaminase